MRFRKWQEGGSVELGNWEIGVCHTFTWSIYILPAVEVQYGKGSLFVEAGWLFFAVHATYIRPSREVA